MTPAKVNLTIYRGRDYAKDFSFTDSDGSASDIGNWDFKAEIRSKKSQFGILFTSFTIVKDISTATISMSLTDTETLKIPEGVAYWDLLVSINGIDETYLTGKIKSIATVTKVS